MKLISSIFILFVVVFISSCDPAPDPNPVTDLRAEISQKWTCEELDGDNKLIFDVLVSKDPNSENKVIMNNFHSLGNDIDVYAIIYDDNTVTIEKQSLNHGNSIVEGDGTISDTYESINLKYYAIEDGDSIRYESTFAISHISKKK